MNRRWTDNARERILWSAAIASGVLCIAVTLLALYLAGGLRTTSMMQDTINKLTHEVGDCRILNM